MAVIYTKTVSGGTANCVIANPRQAVIYPFDVGDWTKIKIGMALSFTQAVNPNADLENQTKNITASNARDRIYYGVKPYSLNFPEENNEPFVGYRTYGSNSFITFPPMFLDHRNEHGTIGYVGMHHPNGSVEGKAYDPGLNQAYGLSPSASFDELSGYGAIIVMQLQILNKGQNNQKIHVRESRTGFTTTSQATIKSLMSTMNLSVQGTFNYNQSGTPYDLPNSFFIYLPFTDLRLRVFSLGVIKEA